MAGILMACGPQGGGRTPAPIDVVTATPNVVLVTIDTLRADHCSGYGYPRPTTPNLDALAEEGTLVRTAYAVTATTLPSHATLFTSLYPSEHGVLKNGILLRDPFTTLAEILGERGWETAAFVSSFAVNGGFGLAQGFELYDDDFRGVEGTISLPAEEWEGHRVEGPFDRRAEATTDRAIRWLRARDPTRPYLLWVHLFDPHAPYDPPQPFRRRFLRSEDAPARERQIDLYDAEVAYADHELGRLLRVIAEVSPPDATLTIVTSDHGEGLGDHGWRGHGIFLYEEAVRIPLVIRWPGRIPSGRELEGPASLIDVLPTLITLLGLDAKQPSMRGGDLAAPLTGVDAIDPDRAIYLQRRLYHTPEWNGIPVAGPKWGVRWRDWKLIEAPLEGTEMYDLRKDPEELTDLAEKLPRVVAVMHDRLEEWQQSIPQVMPASIERPSEEVRERLRALGYVD